MKFILQALTMAALVATGAADHTEGVYLTGTYGGPHDNKYSDEGWSFAGQVVTSITVCSGDRVDGVGLEVWGLESFSDRFCHGGRDGSMNTRTLNTGEHVISVEVHWDKHGSYTRVFFVNFTTSLDNSIVGGTPVPDPNRKARMLLSLATSLAASSATLAGSSLRTRLLESRLFAASEGRT
ncbi:uncharacterized protein IUM83_19057 [Phytophthora cinnamomi]|uniref:uncharacterized protein n=1 Tax=Phytophthora cinnamomi TaxID=4785 RepID=UPI00355ABAAC|nr:hypothetical protein IUM83_19057 [Phytophthora cinnamomi]